MHQTDEEWLTREEAAFHLKVAYSTLAQWAVEGRGPKFSKMGKNYSSPVRYRKSDVFEYLSTGIDSHARPDRKPVKPEGSQYRADPNEAA